MTQTPGPQKPKLPFNEHLAELVLQAIMTGGVSVGGLGAFWQLFKEDSNIPKAIASAVIGLGISYAARMLQPVHVGNQRRLENTGKAIDQGIDRVANQVITKALRFDDWYLQCQALDCQSLRSEGMAQHDRIFIPLLEEVFVPLALGTDGLSSGFRPPVHSLDDMENLEVLENLRIWRFLKQAEHIPTFRQLAILAWGGYGKTTLLKHIAYLYGSKQHGRHGVRKRIPVLLILRKYRTLLAQETPPTLPELITQHHIPGLPREGKDLPVPMDWATTMLRRGEAVVMLDGFDEVDKAQRPAVARWITAQTRRYRKSIFIVTSRPKAYREQDAADRLELTTQLWVQDFKASQRQDFVERWYACQERYAHGGRDNADVQKVASEAAADLLEQIEARPELTALAKNPLLLNMIVTFHRRYPGANLPKRRVELYREICQLQLRDRPRARRLDTLLTECEAQTMLQMLALEMMQQRQERIACEDLLGRLQSYIDSLNELISAQDLLDQVVQISELLVQQEDEYEFAHLSFQEYLAATQIAQYKEEGLLYDHLQDDWWKPTILLYAAQTDPTELIREALRQDATDLAYACLQETSKRVDPALAEKLAALSQAVQTSRYATLENYLKNGEWRVADKETYRLMVTTVGKEEGQWLEPEDLQTFPCKELKAIDELWVKHSNGRFGFSVQKQIYVETGNPLDGQYHRETFQEFGDRTGWRVNGSWRLRNYSNFVVDDAPLGHLPFLYLRQVFWNGGGGFFGGFSSLSLRLVICSR